MSTADPNLLSELILLDLQSPSQISLQMRVYKVIAQAILSGVLAAGHRLPSTRSLSKEVGVSRLTITIAYDKLSAEGYIATRQGQGTFVADTYPMEFDDLHKSTEFTNGNEIEFSKRSMAFLTANNHHSGSGGPFIPGVADTSNFPFHIWQRMQNRYSNKSYSFLTGYGYDGGYWPLRQVLSEYLQISRAVKCEPEQILITMGTNQSLDLCALMLTDNGNTAIVENPCNWSVPVIWKAANLDIDFVGIDEEGLCLNSHSFTKTMDDKIPKLLFTTPSNQYPMGLSMSLPRRRYLLELAQKYNFWIIEDDYDSEFRYDAKPLPSLQGLDTHERVIYLGTFSKTLFPGLRLSYMVVPAKLVKAFNRGLSQIYRPGQLVLQAALSDFIREGYFASHIRRMRAIYSERMHEMRRALQYHFGELITLSQGNSGLHITIEFIKTINLKKMTEIAMSKGITLHELAMYQHTEKKTQGYVLGFGGIKTEEIDAEIKTLKDIYLTEGVS
ncbi:PLP-dependent aminotransferase family protein [Pantoea cypripedii]|uniref:PLP-dependent aminotransferase family protein n=1 Tax=Pantoea cypripedii TaxID=55209 RepID=A0A6B9GCP7_PANCY|nr:PLP-dependent aminotransferase family protein [Pantoea cypripedii]QGY33210.1 PLP-dependent aminotransferase family protein [Pantoea cypripedii]